MVVTGIAFVVYAGLLKLAEQFQWTPPVVALVTGVFFVVLGLLFGERWPR